MLLTWRCRHWEITCFDSTLPRIVLSSVKKAVQNQGVYRILVIVPTGKAAYNVKGSTIHSALHIPVNQSLDDYRKIVTLPTQHIPNEIQTLKRGILLFIYVIWFMMLLWNHVGIRCHQALVLWVVI